MKPLFMIMAAVLVLAVAGGGGYFYFVHSSVDNSGRIAEESGKDGGGHKFGRAQKSQYVTMTPLFLPVLDDNGVTQMISIAITLAVHNDKAVDKVKYMEPRLKDAYILDLYGMLNRHNMKNGVLPLKIIKQRMNTINKDIVGADLIEDILLQVVVQRKVL